MKVCIQDKSDAGQPALGDCEVLQVGTERQGGTAWQNIFADASLVLIHESERLHGIDDVFAKALEHAPVTCLVILYSDAIGWETLRTSQETRYQVWRCSHTCILRSAAELIKRRVQSGRWEQDALGYDPHAALCTAIHELCNLPVRLDAVTAREISAMTEPLTEAHIRDCSEMWEATFASGVPKVLADVRRVESHRDSADCKVDDYIQQTPLAGTLSVSGRVADGGAFGQVVLEMQTSLLRKIGGHQAVRESDVWRSQQARLDLACALREVADALERLLITPLREARATLQHRHG